MKHAFHVTLLLVLFFFLSQLAGLTIVNEYIDVQTTAATGQTTLYEQEYERTGFSPPVVENESFSFLYVLAGVFIGTIFILLIIKFKKRLLWKGWFFIGVSVCLIIAITPFLHKLLVRIPWIEPYTFFLALIIAALLAVYKVFMRNIYVHNLTEILLYGGLAALLVPIFNLTSIILLLVGISLYDMYAVWRSKHMIAMAKFQSSEQVFAGLLMPYRSSTPTPSSASEETTVGKATAERSEGSTVTVSASSSSTKQLKKKKAITKEKSAPELAPSVKSAILGGGDIAFPLLFSGVIMKVTGSYFAPVITTITATIALSLLLFQSKKDTFYPAMPFLSIGSFLGLLIVYLVGFPL